MNIFSRALDRMSECEDDDLWRTFGRLYGPLTQLSLLFPTFLPKYRIFTLILFVFYIGLFPVHSVILVFSLILELDNFFIACLLVHYSLILSYCTFTLTYFNIPVIREKSSMNHRALSSVIGVYRHGEIYKEEIPMQQAKLVKRQTLKLLLLPGFVGVGASILLLLPYVNNFNTGISYTDSGVNQNLPIPAYYPFPSDKGLGHIAAVAAQLSTASGVALIIITSILFYLRVSERLKIEYKVLKHALDTLLERASIVYQQQNLRGSGTLEDPQYQNCVGICLKECVVHHLSIVKLLDGFEMVSCWPVMAVFSVCVFGIAASLLGILNAMNAGDHEKLIMFGLILIGEIASLLILSVIGESVTAEGEELREKLYDTDWFHFNANNKRIFLNFQVGVLEPMVMRAGISTKINLDTFAEIMNTAYSFFNIMNAKMI